MNNRIGLGLLSVLVVLLLLSTFSGQGLGAEFGADMIQKYSGMTHQGKVYVKDKNMRMESQTTEGSAITIMNMDTGKMWILHPTQNMYIEMNSANQNTGAPLSDETISKIADKKHLGAEMVNGYTCDKYLYTYHDKSLGSLTQWVSQELDFPIKMVYPNGEITIEYINIKEGGVEDSLFQIPAGYQKMQIPVMGQGMDKP